MFPLLHSVTNEEQYKILEYTQYRKYEWKHALLGGSHIMNRHLVLSAERTREDKALYVLWLAKMHISG